MKLKINKKVRKLAIAGIAMAGVAVPTVALVACGSSSTSAQTVSYASQPAYEYKGSDVSTKKLFAMMSDPENPRWQKAASDLRTAGAEAKFASVNVGIQKGQVDQNNALDAATDYDAYVLGATEDAGFASQIGKISAKGSAPVIAYDRLLKVHDNNYNWYVTFDSNQVGRLQGLSIINALYGSNFSTAATSDAQITAAVNAKKLSTRTSVYAIAGDPSDNNAKLFFNGAKAVIELAKGLDANLVEGGSWDFDTIAQAKWDYNAGQTYLQTVLSNLSTTEKAQVGAILSPNDGMATSATNAARYAGVDPTKIWITGLDSNDSAVLAIHNDTGQDMTVFKPDYALARVAVALATTLITEPTGTTWTPEEVAAKITQVYPLLSGFSPQLNKVDYVVPASGSVAAKPINTLLLNPVLVTKANLSTFFKVS